MLLSDLSAEERALVEQISVIRAYGEGECVIQEEEAGDSLFLILSGRLEVQKDIDRGRSKRLRELGPDEFFGEMSFFDQAPRSAHILALEDCELLELPMRAFADLVEAHPRVGALVYRSMARELSRRLRESNQELKEAILWAIDGWLGGA